MQHIIKRIETDLSNYWNIKYQQNKCANMFNSDWVSSGSRILFHLYPDTPYEYSNGSIIMQGCEYYNAISNIPSVRLVLNDSGVGFDHAIVAGPVQPEVVEEKDILKTIMKMYGLSCREIVTFGRKLRLLNVSIL